MTETKQVRILIVEDESIIAGDLKDILEEQDYNVVGIAATGIDAIEKCQSEQPDLVFMDIRLRGNMDGIEAAQNIYSKYNIPIIYLTAYANDEFLVRAKETQPFGYILKPFDERILHPSITMALEKHRQEAKLKKSEEKYRSFVDENQVEVTLRFLPNGTFVDNKEIKIPELIQKTEKILNKVASEDNSIQVDEGTGETGVRVTSKIIDLSTEKAEIKELSGRPTHSNKHKPLYSMKVVTQRTNLDANLIRHYERQGLIKPYRDPDNNYRLFTLDEIEWLERINRLIHEVGINIEGIKLFLTLDPCYSKPDFPKDIKERCAIYQNKKYPCWYYIKPTPENPDIECYKCPQYILAKRHPKLEA